MKRFEQLPHTADIKIRAWGATKEELFTNVLFGMFQCIGPHADGCKRENDLLMCNTLDMSHEVEVQSRDLEALLVDFLSEALYLSDVHNEAYFDAKFRAFTNKSLHATIYGVKITGFEVVELKAVTYHDLKIVHKDGIWQTEIVFDI